MNDMIDFFKLKPRINRTRHVAMVSFWFAIALLAALPIDLYRHHSDYGHLFERLSLFHVGTFSGVIGVIATINILFLKIRRLHDFNFSAWWLLLLPVPLVGFFFAIAIFFIPGTDKKNRFGNPVLSHPKSEYWLIASFPLVFALAFFFFERS